MTERVHVAVAAVVVAIVVGAVALAAWGGSSSLPRVPARLPDELAGPAPWPRHVTGLRARLDALGMPAQEGALVDTHEHLDIYVNGRRVRVPAGIGIDERDGVLAPLHTHDATGIIHVESPVDRTFTLGEFFGVWGVRLTPRCLGGYCDARARELRVYVNGERLRGDPRELPLEEHDEIVITDGTRALLPSPIPSSYRFPYGL